MASDHFSASFKISVATLIGAVFSFLTLWLLARNLDVASFGAFSVAWTGIQALIPLAVIGIPQYVLHRYKAVGPGAACYFAPAAKGLVLFSLLSASLYGAWLALAGVSQEVRSTGLVLTVWLLMVIPVVAVYAKYQYEHRLPALVYWPLWQILPRTLVVVIVLLFDMPMFYVAVGFVLMLSPLTWIALRELLALPASAGGSETNRMRVTSPELIADAWPYGIAEWLEKLDLRLIVPLVAVVGTDQDAAYVAVSASLLFLIYLLPSSILQRYFLPHLHEWSAHDPARLYRFAYRWILLLAGGSLLLIPILWIISGPAIIRLYGAGYAPAVEVFNVMILVVPILLISGVISKTFLKPSEVRKLVLLQTLSLLLLLAGVWFFFSRVGLIAMAWVFVSARLFLLLSLSFAAWRNYRQNVRFNKAV